MMILAFMPLINFLGRPATLKHPVRLPDVCVIVWGGLRGAVGLVALHHRGQVAKMGDSAHREPRWGPTSGSKLPKTQLAFWGPKRRLAPLRVCGT